jgi:hypothetical protein
MLLRARGPKKNQSAGRMRPVGHSLDTPTLTELSPVRSPQEMFYAIFQSKNKYIRVIFLGRFLEQFIEKAIINFKIL